MPEYPLYQTLVKMEEDRNHANRYKARKKYYEKEENKEKKRIYMREYSKRPKKENDNLHALNSERFIEDAQR